MQFLPSSNGLTSIHVKNVRFYRGTIDLRFTNRFTVISSLKEWVDSLDKDIGTVSMESTSFYRKDNGFSEALTISGYYPIESSNENEMYETIYSLFQFLCIKCKQNEVLFYLHSLHSLHSLPEECKEYKIVCKNNL